MLTERTESGYVLAQRVKGQIFYDQFMLENFLNYLEESLSHRVHVVWSMVL